MLIEFVQTENVKFSVHNGMTKILSADSITHQISRQILK